MEGIRMIPQSVVKIDLCRSKLFSQEREKDYPEIRKELAEKLKMVALSKFPYSEKKYPEGSFYKVEGDAVYFIIDRPTVAIRSAIEFMKEWYYQGIKHQFPESKIIIHRGIIDEISVPEGKDFVGKVFEDVDSIEKTLAEGKIYVTDDVKRNSDMTISKFVNYGNRNVAEGRILQIYYIAFCDPRTFENDALAHLLFIAHEASKETRVKIIRFFLVEYLIEKKELSDISKFEIWSKSKGYPCLPKDEIKELLNDDYLFCMNHKDGLPFYSLKEDRMKEIIREEHEYEEAKKLAVSIIREEILNEIKTEKAVENFDIEGILKEYLCGMFSEIRILANYFRDTSHFYESDSDTFERYDWIIERHFSGIDDKIVSKWKDAFIRGLKKVTQRENIFISAIFYNILAGYYLNRTFQTSPYQLENLQKRKIFLDTNVLYSLRCKSSSYHERVNYFADRLKKIGVTLRIYPFSIDEFEASLDRAEKEYKKDPYSHFLLVWNPWLIQEFRTFPQKYLNDISVCRMKYSITKGEPVNEENFEKLDKELSELNLLLEKGYQQFEEKKKNVLWQKLRSLILSKSGDMEDYWFWSERLAGSKESIIEHDVNLLKNVKQVYADNRDDSLGPSVLLITIDSKLIKCRKEYPFIISTEQFLEFIMPYLFLADIPDEDPDGFPNLILSAQLGVHTSFWKPQTNDYAMMALKNPEILSKEGLAPDLSLFSKTVSQTRFRSISEKAPGLSDKEREYVLKPIVIEAEESIKKFAENEFLKKELNGVKKRLADETREKETLRKKVNKLQKTLRYFKMINR
jgi:hypothetical protein